jgi:hypothetical protein
VTVTSNNNDDPAAVFGTVVTARWSEQLCRLLIQHREEIERELGPRYDELCGAIEGWHCQHQGGDTAASSRALFDICNRYEVIAWMQRERLIEKPRPSVTTRGAGPSRPPGADDDLTQRLSEVAARFQRS